MNGDKITRRNIALIVTVLIILFLLFTKRGKQLVSNIFNAGDVFLGDLGGPGDISLGGITLGNINITSGAGEAYEQQSSCGCSVAYAEISGPSQALYLAPASVVSQKPNVYQYTQLVVAPPKVSTRPTFEQA